jgi:osmotically-inducible protein OsmY
MAFIVGGFFFAAPMAYAESNEGTEAPTNHHIAKRVKSEKGVVPQDKDVVDPATAADNTGINKRDRVGTEATADQQKNNKSDVAVTAEIRRAIMKDKTLSTNAHNVKIIVKNGNVTLKGPVGSQTERTAVEKAALDAIGPGKGTITNEVSVAP